MALVPERDPLFGIHQRLAAAHDHKQWLETIEIHPAALLDDVSSVVNESQVVLHQPYPDSLVK